MSFLRAFRRKLSKNRRHNYDADINLDNITHNLAFRQDLGSVYNPDKDDGQSHFANYFMILGPHHSTPAKPSLLFCYPSHRFPFTASNFDRIIQLCYPSGMETAQGTGEQIIDQFVFGLNNDGALLFGVCSHVNLCSASMEFMTKVNSDTAFCFCSITSIPHFNTHFLFHQFILDSLFFKETIASDIDLPFLLSQSAITEEFSLKPSPTAFSSFQPPLALNSKNSLIATTSECPIPDSFLNSVAIYMRVQVSPTETFRLNLSPRYQLTISSRSDSLKEIARSTYDVLFSCLGVQNTVRYFRSLLLEQRVLIISSKLSQITNCVLSAIPLLSPMAIQTAIMPILPNNRDFLEYINSPVPFIFGVLKTPLLEEVGVPDDITVINIDSNEIAFPEDTPHLPNANVLRKTLEKCIEKMEVEVPNSDSYKFWEARRAAMLPTSLKRCLRYSFCPEHTERVFCVFLEYMKGLVSEERLAGCRVRDTTDTERPVVGFVKDAYMLGVKPEETDFVEQFLATQTFHQHCEKTFQ